jgi:transglutaminase-like putative cysteine protease
LSTAECFATYKRGFCQYYAATMAVLLCDLGVPTRIAGGFLPGAVNPNTGIETIQMSSAHAWVEVYFRAMAGSCSTRPAATCPRSSRCR